MPEHLVSLEERIKETLIEGKIVVDNSTEVETATDPILITIGNWLLEARNGFVDEGIGESVNEYLAYVKRNLRI